MIIVSDTSPIANLIIIKHLDLLRILFQNIIVPPAVDREIRALSKFGYTIDDYLKADWIKIHPPLNAIKVELLKDSLDEGEAEAIALAIEYRCDFLLIDERIGTNAAKNEGLKTIGLVGVLIKAKQKGVVKAIKPILENLKSKAGFWIGEALLVQILKDAEEF
ncbi:MAG: DUF3368 domain-containing protein [Spirosomaceae bacterium]|jgi:uncharacterized protein|nr:DUF3368 domain-containing protein [Spirosomataceae bacterium]